jgi:ParB family chromosome partitioning protein
MPKLTILNVSQHIGTEDSRAVSLSIKDIPIGEISVKKNVRSEYKNIDELKASIRQYGLLQPITVYKDGNAYGVKTGHRRFLAFKSLYNEAPDKFHSIRCIIADTANISVIQLIENIQRADLSQLDLYNALSAFKEQGLSLKQIADILGKTESYIKKVFTGINAIKLEPELKAYIGSAGGTIQDVLETKGIPNKEERLSLLEQRKRGIISRAQMRKKVKDLKGVSLENTGGSAGGTSPEKEPDSAVDGTVSATPRELVVPHSVHFMANQKQRSIVLSFDTDEPYSLVFASLKNIFNELHFICIESEAHYV